VIGKAYNLLESFYEFQIMFILGDGMASMKYSITRPVKQKQKVMNDSNESA